MDTQMTQAPQGQQVQTQTPQQVQTAPAPVSRNDTRSEAERKVIELVNSKPGKGASREEIGHILGVTRPTVDKIIKGLKLKVISKERRKEFFGLPSQKQGDTQLPSGQYRTPTQPTTPSGQFKLPSGGGSSVEKDRQKTMLLEAALANARVIESLSKGL